MPPSHALRAVALAALLVLAGCGAGVDEPATTNSPADASTDTTTATATATAPTAPDTTSTTSTRTTTPSGDGPDITLHGGELGFDHRRTWTRVESLLDADATPPSDVYLRPNDTLGTGFDDVDSAFFRRVTGVSPPDEEAEPRVTGISLATGGASPRYVEYVLAHEYAHDVQFERVQDTAVMRAAFEADDHQTERVSGAIIEGGASYVADEYVREYRPDAFADVRRDEPSYRNMTTVGKYAFAPYHFGRRYVAARADSPADHWRVYDSPPETTEQLLHDYSPDEEPPRNLSVAVRPGDGARADRNQTMGELFVRLTLTSELPEDDAARAAAGWGADELVTVEDGGNASYAWVLRWDDEANASEFETAFERFLDERAERRDGTWTANGTAFDLRRASDDTVVVLVGEGVRDASVSADGSEVEIRPTE